MVDQLSGTSTNGSNGSGAISQSVTNSDNTNGTFTTATVAITPNNSNNYGYAAAKCDNAFTLSAQSSFSVIGDGAGASNNATTEGGSISGVTALSETFASTTTRWAIIGLEIVVALTGSITVGETGAFTLAAPTVGSSIVPTSLTTGFVPGGGTSISTAAITPGANQLVLCTVAATPSGVNVFTAPTLTGNSLTWVLVKQQIYNTSRGVWVFRALGASPTNGAITINFGTSNQAYIEWIVDQFSNVNTTGSNGSGAISQAVGNGGVSVGPATVSITPNNNADFLYSVAAVEGADFQKTLTPAAPFSVLDALTSINPSLSSMDVGDGNSVSGVSVSWGTPNPFDGWGIIALEIIRSASLATQNAIALGTTVGLTATPGNVMHPSLTLPTTGGYLPSGGLGTTGAITLATTGSMSTNANLFSAASLITLAETGTFAVSSGNIYASSLNLDEVGGFSGTALMVTGNQNVVLAETGGIVFNPQLITKGAITLAQTGSYTAALGTIYAGAISLAETGGFISAVGNTIPVSVTLPETGGNSFTTSLITNGLLQLDEIGNYETTLGTLYSSSITLAATGSYANSTHLTTAGSVTFPETGTMSTSVGSALLYAAIALAELGGYTPELRGTPISTPLITLTGDLKDLIGSDQPGIVVLTLCGYGQTPPVVGGGNLVILQTKVKISTTGIFSTSIFGNDAIDMNSFYQVDILSLAGQPLFSQIYQFIGSGVVDLSNATAFQPAVVFINPLNAIIKPSTTQQFSAQVIGIANHAVTWSVDGIPNGNATVGTVSSTGLYSAPSTIGTHTITATSVGAPTASASAIISVLVSIVNVSVSPQVVTMGLLQTQQFQATVSGTFNFAVLWFVDSVQGGNTPLGTISSTGLYTSPNTIGGHNISAVSLADPTKSDIARVNVTTTGVSITLQPARFSMLTGAQVQYNATVSGSSNTGVTFQVDGNTGGNATTGTISTGGLYTAPSTAGNHTVTAISKADTSVTASATVTVTSVLASVTIIPTVVTMLALSTQQFTATVTNGTSQQVFYDVDGINNGNATVGTITVGGLYTAPNSNSSHVVTASYANDLTRKAQAAVTVTQGGIAVSVSPNTATIGLGAAQQYFATVNGTANQNCTFLVDNVAGGNATVGRISASGLYTAPSSGAGTHTITAVSVANPAASGTAQVIVSATSVPAIIPAEFFSGQLQGQGINYNTPFPTPAVTGKFSTSRTFQFPIAGSASETKLDKWITYLRGVGNPPTGDGQGYVTKLIVTLTQFGAWAANNTGTGGTATWTSNYLNNIWTPMLNHFAAKYGKGGTNDATDVIDCVEIWNEPDANPTGSGMPGGFQTQCINNYIALAQIAYPILHAAGFLCGGPTPQSGPLQPTGSTTLGLNFLYTWASAGGGQYCDVITRHHYRVSPEDMFARINNEILFLQTFTDPVTGTAGKPMWLTEINVAIQSGLDLPENQGVAFLERAYILAWMAGQYTSGGITQQLLTRMYWYGYDTTDPSTKGGLGILQTYSTADPGSVTNYPSTPGGGETIVAQAWGIKDGSVTTSFGSYAWKALKPQLIGSSLSNLVNDGGSPLANYSVNIVYADGHNGTVTWTANGTNFSNANAIPKFNTSTTTVLTTSDPNPTFGTPITLTATVTSGAGVPTGTVTFKDGTVTLGTGTLNGSGVATLIVSTLSAGVHNLTAVYGGA